MNTHYQYKLGTLEHRLAHVCAALEIDPPRTPLKDELTQEHIEWFAKHEVSMDWVLAGNPTSLVRCYSTVKRTLKEAAASRNAT